MLAVCEEMADTLWDSQAGSKGAPPLFRGSAGWGGETARAHGDIESCSFLRSFRFSLRLHLQHSRNTGSFVSDTEEPNR